MKTINKINKALCLSVLFGCTAFTTQVFAKQSLTATLKAYPGSSLSAPTGNVTVSFKEASLHVAYHMKNTTASSQGGIHIHAGTTCDDAKKVGGHYWRASLGEDTWKHTIWESDINGQSKGSFKVNNGYNYEENISHAVVIHNLAGTRIACGILKPNK